MAERSTKRPEGGSPDFEQAMARLERIVAELEEGRLGLADALARYEEGVSLLRGGYEMLRRAERRIELLSGVDAQGHPVSAPFDASATFSAEEPETAKRRSRRRSTTANQVGDDQAETR